MDFSVVVLDWSGGYKKPNVLYPIQNQISSKKEGLSLSFGLPSIQLPSMTRDRLKFRLVQMGNL
jgi:hypothetical protein